MSIETESFYDKFSFFYPLVDGLLRPQKKVLFEEINRQPEGSLLEIGVGNGGHLHLYKKHKITGIDTSSAMLARAKKQNQANVALLKMDGNALSFEDALFDYVVLSHVIAVVDDPECVLSEVSRVLKPNGRLIILNHFTPDNCLKYLDRAFAPLSSMLRFKSVFYMHRVRNIRKFTLLKEVPLGVGSYFKLLIYQKK